MDIDLASLVAEYRAERIAPVDTVREVYQRIRAGGDRHVWIHLIPEEESVVRAESLGAFRQDLPLYGVPFAVKDNIDLAGVPTTAGCPQYAYTPDRSAHVVDRLMAAGAIPIGKTNLDQFATGLVGTRSPYGACSSVVDERYISGGSSSGSAVAVAAELVSFALGTDTAGSGRVPAAFNKIVGLKPTRGSISGSGLVPACRTLDCVSIFARNCSDAARVLSCASSFDPEDAYSRPSGQQIAWPRRGFRFGTPTPELLEFFGDESAPFLFETAAQYLQDLGGTRVSFDFAIFREAAELLYSGPWVAERLAAIREFVKEHPAALHPVTAKIILNADKLTAVAAFEAMYRLAEIARAAQGEWGHMDFMLLPTAGNCYTHEQIEAEPIMLNTNLGYYTNFVNLLDLSAIAIPAGTRTSGMPFGVTLVAPAWGDRALTDMAGRLHRCYGAADGDPDEAHYCPEGYVPLAVCGAHLSGQPLNYQMAGAGAFLIETCRTTEDYKLYALCGTRPAKPGLIRVASGGSGIEVEVWAVPMNRFGGFVTAVPPPLAIGNCVLENGRTVKSFLCEPTALSDAEDITYLGAWRTYVAMRNQP